MIRRVAARLLLLPPTLLGITLVTFLLVHLAPGDPASLRAGVGRGVTPEVIAENRALAGLDRPLHERYLVWISRSAQLDFGASLVDGRSVRARIAEALPHTALLSLCAILFSASAALVLGAIAAARSRSAASLAIDWIVAAAYGFPSLALALLLLRIGAPYGASSPLGLLPPALCLALAPLATLTRQVRVGLGEALGADFARTARAQGASDRRVLVRHALRNGLSPMVTLLGSQVPALLSGSVVVEQIFGVRGLGMLGFEAVLSRDYPMLMGLCTLGAVFTLGGVLLADAVALALDPRRRTEAE